MNTSLTASIRAARPRWARSSPVLWLIAAALLVGIFATFPWLVHASSFQVPTNVLTVPVGSTFTVPIVVDPAGEAQYTARFSATFPDVLEVTSFRFASGWIPVSQPGYDVEDNKRGQLVKTAGFPKGLSSAKSFGVITFRAKATGEALITIGAQSFILNAQSSSTLRSRPQVRVTITERAAPTPAPTPAPAASTLTIHPTSSTPFLAGASPDQPTEAQNLFDITAEPRRKESGLPLFFLGGAFVLGVLMILFAQFAVARSKHWWFARKQKT